ncbi:MAG: Fe2+-dependent dioxygenase [Alphaproteobacteria bacterium]|nr:Fe2+-dependent dioxygenase [Alphaproteobacteria bacterium]
MHHAIHGILSQRELAEIHRTLAAESFVDGGTTASGAAVKVKNNLQIDTESSARKVLAQIVGGALTRNEELSALAFPKALAIPTFARYDPGMEYGMHVDAPFLGGGTIRADISITVFLSPPEAYDGGELVLDLNGAETKVKLAAGDGYIYPTTYRHRVAPVTRGTRLVAVSWIQSHLPDENQRQIAVQMNQVKLSLEADPTRADDADTMRAAVFNLLRLWWQT